MVTAQLKNGNTRHLADATQVRHEKGMWPAGDFKFSGDTPAALVFCDIQGTEVGQFVRAEVAGYDIQEEAFGGIV